MWVVHRHSWLKGVLQEGKCQSHPRNAHCTDSFLGPRGSHFPAVSFPVILSLAFPSLAPNTVLVHLWSWVPQSHYRVDATGGQEAVAGVWLQAVDNGFIPLEHSDEVGGLLFPDEEGAVIRAADDVLSIAGGGKGRGGQVGDCPKGAGKAEAWAHSALILKGPPLAQNSPMQTSSLFQTACTSHHCIKTQH